MPAELRKLFVPMDEILDAIDTHGEGTVFYLDTNSGQLELWIDPVHGGEENQFDPEDDRYARVPRPTSDEEYQAMERFVDQLEETDVQAELRPALQGKEAFGRFRAVLAGYPDLRARWEQDKRQGHLQEALTWLAGLGIDPQYELRPAPAPPAIGQDRSHAGQVPVGFIDLLLLGAREGKAEPIDGRVSRLLLAADDRQARKIFGRLAREIAEHHGLAWRKSFIEGSDRFEQGRFLLTVSGRKLVLSVEVAPALWKRFHPEE
jgi:hypothetical protein